MRAARLSGAAEAVCNSGFVFEGFERAIHWRTVDAIQQAFGDEALEEAMAEGRAWAPDEAVAYALEGMAHA